MRLISPDEVRSNRRSIAGVLIFNGEGAIIHDVHLCASIAAKIRLLVKRMGVPTAAHFVSKIATNIMQERTAINRKAFLRCPGWSCRDLPFLNYTSDAPTVAGLAVIPMCVLIKFKPAVLGQCTPLKPPPKARP